MRIKMKSENLFTVTPTFVPERQTYKFQQMNEIARSTLVDFHNLELRLRFDTVSLK